LDSAGLDAYARFSPDGIVAQQIGRQGVHGTMPYLRMATDLRGSPAEAARAISRLNRGAPPRFTVCRSILQTPTWYAQVEKELQAMPDECLQVVDLYTLLWLVREYEAHRADYVDLRYARAPAVSATPARSDGLAPTFAPDGPVQEADHDGTRCWRIAGAEGKRYLYFDADDAFYQPGSGPLEIALEFLDQGTGRIVLHYDSTDAGAILGGAYKSHATVVACGNTGRWRSVAFTLPDARFAGSQNGNADFRFYHSGENLVIRGVRVARR
jgi:hypothetical protein